MKFPNQLSKARESAGLSQEGLARVIGYATSTVQKWETGTFVPNPLLQDAILKKVSEYKNQNKK